MKLLLFSGDSDSTCIAVWQRPDILLPIGGTTFLVVNTLAGSAGGEHTGTV